MKIEINMDQLASEVAVKLVQIVESESKKKKPDIIYTVEELAGYLRMSRTWVYENVKSGKLPCFKMGDSNSHIRFKKHVIDCWIKEHTTGGI